MNFVEQLISDGARRWLDRRRQARAQGGGLFYWIFAYLGGGIVFFAAAKIVQQHHWLSFPLYFGVALLIGFFWVRTAWYRMHPIKMFGATFVLMVTVLTVLM